MTVDKTTFDVMTCCLMKPNFFKFLQNYFFFVALINKDKLPKFKTITKVAT
jgi:hypothetical protein